LRKMKLLSRHICRRCQEEYCRYVESIHDGSLVANWPKAISIWSQYIEDESSVFCFHLSRRVKEIPKECLYRLEHLLEMQ